LIKLEDPDNIMLNFRYAQTQIKNNNLLGAAGTLERILLVNPNLSKVRLGIGFSFIQKRLAKKFQIPGGMANVGIAVCARRPGQFVGLCPQRRQGFGQSHRFGAGTDNIRELFQFPEFVDQLGGKGRLHGGQLALYIYRHNFFLGIQRDWKLRIFPINGQS